MANIGEKSMPVLSNPNELNKFRKGTRIGSVNKYKYRYNGLDLLN